MRILFLTNFYPPAALGGQGESCQQVVRGLRQRGHVTAVLTSNHRHNEIVSADGSDIRRKLNLEMDFVPWRHAISFFLLRQQKERENLTELTRYIQDFNPDVIFIWGMWNLPRSLPALAEKLLPGRVLYRFAEYWPTLPSQHVMYWQTPGRSRLSRIPKQIAARLALKLMASEASPELTFPHAYCVSDATRRKLLAAGVPIRHAGVIHTGIPVEPFFKDRKFGNLSNGEGPLKLIFAGRLSPDKGVHTAVQALSRLLQDMPGLNIELTLAGGGSGTYVDRLRVMVREAKLQDRVTFKGKVPAEQMPALFGEHDILLVPSIWDEPFARVVLEGMLSGLAVIAAESGGTPEILKSGRNGLLCKPDDPAALAGCLQQLASDPHKRIALARAGQNTILDHYTLDAMLDRIEALLAEVAVGKIQEDNPAWQMEKF